MIKIAERTNTLQRDCITQFTSLNKIIIPNGLLMDEKYFAELDFFFPVSTSDSLTLWRLNDASEITEEKGVKLSGRECKKLFVDDKYVVLLCWFPEEIPNEKREISLRSPTDFELIRSKLVVVKKFTDFTGFYYANGWIGLAKNEYVIEQVSYCFIDMHTFA